MGAYLEEPAALSFPPPPDPPLVKGDRGGEGGGLVGEKGRR